MNGGKEEEWRKVPGFDNIEASSLGRVRNLATGTCHYGNDRPTGYKEFSINGKNYPVHQLVCAAFHDKNDYKYIDETDELLIVPNHIDKNKSNNRADNLEWCTQRYNTVHALPNVYKYDLYGNYVDEQICAFGNQKINICCRNESGQSEGYQWRYYKQDKIEPFSDVYVPVVLYTKHGRFLGRYNGIVDIEEFSDNVSGAIRACRVGGLYMYKYRICFEDDTHIAGLDLEPPTRVYQWNLDGTLEKEWQDFDELDDSEYDLSSVVKCCDGKSDSYNKYVWTYDNKFRELPPKVCKPYKTLYEWDLEGNLLKIYDNGEKPECGAEKVWEAISANYAYQGKVYTYAPEFKTPIKDSGYGWKSYSKILYQWDMDWNFIQEFPSISGRARSLGLKSANHLREVIDKPTRSYKGFRYTTYKI